MLKKLAFAFAEKLAAGKPAPPLKYERARVWDAFFFYVGVLFAGTSLLYTLPELVALSVIKSHTGWDKCAGVPLTALVGSEVFTGIVSLFLIGGSVCQTASQFMCCLYEAAASLAILAIAAPVIATEGAAECGTAVASLACAFIGLVEGMPYVLGSFALLALSCYRHDPELPLVNLYANRPPRIMERSFVPRRFWVSELYELPEGEC